MYKNLSYLSHSRYRTLNAVIKTFFSVLDLKMELVMILGYLDNNEKNIDVEKQRQQILHYASENGLTIDMFVQESGINALQSSLKTNNHTVIFANIVALGTSLLQIKESISMLFQLNLTIILVKEGYMWQPDDLRTIPAQLELVVNIRNSLSSIVTKRALDNKKASDISLGRISHNKKRMLDGKQGEIISRRMNGETNLQIAKALEVTPTTLYSFYRQHPEIKKLFAGGNNA